MKKETIEFSDREIGVLRTILDDVYSVMDWNERENEWWDSDNEALVVTLTHPQFLALKSALKKIYKPKVDSDKYPHKEYRMSSIRNLYKVRSERYIKYIINNN
jgi:hypothetical protein